MKVVWMLISAFHVLLSSLVVCRFLSQESIDALISYHKEFRFHKILVQFHENEKMVLDVSKIKYFFMFPNNFYCENVKVNDTPLPLFFINSTKKDFFTLILSLLKVEQNHVENLLDKYSSLGQCKNGILNMRKNLQELFPCANSIQDIEKEITHAITSLENENSIHNPKENDQVSLSNVNSTRDPIKNSIENIDTSATKEHIENWKLNMRYIIPAVYLKTISFVSKEIGHAYKNSSRNMYLKYNDENFSDNVECIGSGSYSSCYRVAMQFNKKSSHENFVFKMLCEKIKSLKEITIFSHIPIDEQHGFCRPQSVAIGNDGKCAGYLMKYAEFGHLANFTRKHQGKDYRYFYNQLFNVAKAINTLHQKGISHNDVNLDNIFVCKKDDAEVENNYYFQLGDFGISHITSFYNYDNDSDDNIPKKQAETKISENVAKSCSDVSNFINILPKVLASLYLKNVNKSEQKSLILTMTLKDPCKFDGIEEYFKDIDSSFTNTDSIKSSEIAECSNLKYYRFTKTPQNFVVLDHTPDRCVRYSKGETLTLDYRFTHKLYCFRHLNYTFAISSSSGIMNSINSFYERNNNMKGVLVIVENFDFSKVKTLTNDAHSKWSFSQLFRKFSCFH